MKTRTLNKEIMRLTLPAIVSNITMPLLGLSDTTVAGHLGSPVFIGAIAVGSMMQNVVFWLFGFLRMGTTGLTAQHYGAGDSKGCREVFSRSIFLGAFIGLQLLVLREPLKALLLRLMGPDGDVAVYATEYFDICIWGAPAMLVTMAIQGWLLGMQTTVLPMIVTITVNLLNITLSLLLVFAAGMGFVGVAYGTLCATLFGVVLALLMAKYRVRGGRLWAGWRSVGETSSLGRFFRVNTDIFFRSACIISVSMTVTAIGARLGALTLAANAVIVQFYIFFSYCMDGFSFTGEALCGRFAGSGERPLLLRSVRLLLLWSAAMAAAFTLAYAFGYRDIVSLITSESDVVEEIRRYRLWIILLPSLSVLAFIYDGFFIGLTATRRMLAVTAVASAVFMAVSFVHFSTDGISIGMPTNNEMWLAFELYLFFRGILLAVQSKKVFSLKPQITN